MREGGGFRETPPPSLKYPLLLLIFRLITDFDIISCNVKKLYLINSTFNSFSLFERAQSFRAFNYTG